MADQRPQGPAARHPAYVAMADKWRRCRDVSAGQDAMHAAGDRYIPRLREQSDADYRAYVRRAPFYNATWRTIAGLNGMLFRKPPKIDAAASVLPLFEDVTLSGMPLHLFAQTIAEECLTVGRVGVLTDYPTGGEGLTQADAARLNLRPTLAMYRAESIINWRYRVINNAHTLCLVVLCEEYAEQTGEFTDAMSERYRVLDLTPGGYRQRIFTLDRNGRPVQQGADVFPLLNNRPLDFIPFAFIAPDDNSGEVDEPPLIDLVNMNVSHYLNSADLEAAAHISALPQAYISGYRREDDSERFYIGGASAWAFPDPATSVGYLEYKGDGLGTLTGMMEAKERRMAVLGARMLEDMKRGVETAEAAGIHRAGEQAMLASVAQSISLGLSRPLQWFATWAGSDEPASIEINRDFVPTNMSPDELKGLVQAWQQGAISFATLFDNLKAGEIVGAQATAEDEQAAIASAPPQLVGGL